MVDEVVRWATPVTVFQRTALNDVEVGGVPIKKGQRVGAVLRLGELRRGRVRRPVPFDILRDPNPHVAFGGHGAHYCLGANLARQEIRLIFNALADQAPDITKVAEPRRLRHGWINGIKDFRSGTPRWRAARRGRAGPSVGALSRSDLPAAAGVLARAFQDGPADGLHVCPTPRAGQRTGHFRLASIGLASGPC